MHEHFELSDSTLGWLYKVIQIERTMEKIRDMEVIEETEKHGIQKPLTEEQYKLLEYGCETYNSFEGLMTPLDMEGANTRHKIKHLESLLDAALLGKDTEWAREIHNQILKLKSA